MNIETTFVAAQVPVTVLTTHGDIDGSNYQELISAVKTLYDDGTRNLLLDLGDTSFISSSGLAALHSVALIMNGDRSLNTEDAWTTLRTMGLGLGMLQMHLKLLNVQPRVDRTLTISGMRAFFEIYNDRDVALASFRPEKTIP